MNINTTTEDKKILIALEGWLDTASAPDLTAVIDGITEAASITIDFDKVEYIASSGVRSIIAGYRKANELGALYSIINVSTEIMNIFKLTQIDKKFNIQAK